MRSTTFVAATACFLLCGAFSAAASTARLTGVPQPRSAWIHQQSTARPDTQKFMGKILSQNDVRLIFRYDGSDTWYNLDDQATAGKFVGKDVVITGTFDGLSGTIRIQSIRERTADDQLPAQVEASPSQPSEPAKSSSTPPAKPDVAAPAPQQANPPQPPVVTVPAPPAATPVAPKRDAAPPPPVQKPAVAARRNSELLLPEEAVAASSSVAITSRRSIEVPVSAESHARQSVSNLVVGKPLTRTVPSYPSEAQQQGVEGTVKLHAVIAANGSVESVEPVSGPPALVDAAVTAVREWRFAPTKYDGRPVRAQDEITLFFRLPN